MTEPATKPWPAMSIAQATALLTAPGARLEMETVTIRGVPTRVWKNCPPTNREVFLAGRVSSATASSSGLRRRPLHLRKLRPRDAEAGRRAADATAWRRATGSPSSCATCPNGPVAFYAAELVGAIVTPLNAWWTGPELEYGLVDSGTKIAVRRRRAPGAHRRASRQLPGPEEDLCQPLSDEDLPSPIVHRLEDVIGKVNDWGKLPPGEMPDVELQPDDDATILYTSGTTGKPKGALGTQRNMTSNIMAAGFSAARNFLRRGEPVPVVANPLDAPQRSTLLSVPFFHATGCFAVLGPTVVSGGKIVLMRKFEAEKAMELIEREKINSAGGVPTIAWQLLEHPNRHKYDLSSLEAVAYGGAPSAPELVQQDQAELAQVRARQRLGHDRDLGHLHHALGRGLRAPPDSCGPPVAVCDLKIMDVEGTRELPVGEVGELWARGPQHREGLLEQARGHRRDLRRRLGAHRRSGAPRRGRLLLHHRPRQGHADPRRREHLLHRGRERPLRPSGRDGRRPGRRCRTSSWAKSPAPWCI